MSYWHCFFLKISCYFALKLLAWASVNLGAPAQKNNCALFQTAVTPLLQRAVCASTVRLCHSVILHPEDHTPGSRCTGLMPLVYSSQYYSFYFRWQALLGKSSCAENMDDQCRHSLQASHLGLDLAGQAAQ